MGAVFESGRGKDSEGIMEKRRVVSRLCDVLQEAKSAGLSDQQLKKNLQQLGLLTNHSPKTDTVDPVYKTGCNLLNCLLFKVYPLVFLLALLAYPLFKLLIGSPCLISEVTPLGEAAMPLVDCNMCKGVTEVPRLKNLSREEFVHNYAYTSKPILVVGAALDWPALQVYSYDYFKDLYLNTPGALDDDMIQGQFFSYSSNIRDLKELFELPSEVAAMSEERWYIGWSTADPSIGAQLRKHISSPYFIPPGHSHMELAWIFMGAPGPGASIHVDMVELSSWQAQLSGTKTWTLTPPPECEHVCQTLNATLYRGDIIVVDTNKWFHQTYIHPGNISITIGSEYH